MNLVNQKLGAEGQVTVDLVGGSLNVSVTETTAGASGTLTGSLNLAYFVDAGAAKLNSPLATAMAAILDGVLKGIA